MASRILNENSASQQPSINNFYKNRSDYNLLLPAQRHYVWDKSRASELIVSIIKGYPFGNLVVSEDKTTGKYDVLDGVQRSTSIFNFFSNKYSLNENTEGVIIDDKEYVLAGKTYEELDQEVKNTLATRIVFVQVYKDLTDEECDEIIRRLNMGVQLSTIAMARLMDRDVREFVTEVSGELFDRKIDIQKSAKENFKDVTLLYAVLALECGLEDISAVNSTRIIELIKERNLLTDEIKVDIVETIDFMNNVYPAKHKSLSYQDFLSIYSFCKEIRNDKISYREVYKIIDGFYSKKNAEYVVFRSITGELTLNKIKDKTQILKSYYDRVKK